jgi:hypothetical protein
MDPKPSMLSNSEFTDYQAVLHAKKPSIIGIAILILWIMCCAIGLGLFAILFFMPDMDTPLWAIIFMIVMLLGIVLFSSWGLKNLIKRRNRSKKYLLGFSKYAFHYHMPEEDFTIEYPKILRFEFSTYYAGTVKPWLALIYQDEQGKEVNRNIDHHAFPAKVGVLSLTDWLNARLHEASGKVS